MSLESKIDKLIAAVEANTAALTATPATPAAPVAVESAPAAPVEAVAPTPAPVVAPVPAPQVTAPTPVAPVAAVPTTALPFADSAGLTAYVMGKYQTLGPEKGAGIQTVLQGLGFANINDVTEDKFQEFFNGVEAIA